jgi:hypothetical protein
MTPQIVSVTGFFLYYVCVLRQYAPTIVLYIVMLKIKNILNSSGIVAPLLYR